MKLFKAGSRIINLDLLTWADKDEKGKVTLHFPVAETVQEGRRPTNWQSTLQLNGEPAKAVWATLERAQCRPDEAP